MFYKKTVIAGCCSLLAIVGCIDKDQIFNNNPVQPEIQKASDDVGWYHPSADGVTKKGLYPIDGEYQEIEYVLTNTGEAVFEGDIILDNNLFRDPEKSGLSKTQALVFADRNNLWSNGVIPYTIESDVPQSKKDLILLAMEHWKANTTIRFVPNKGQSPYLRIASVDMWGGPTNICGATIACQKGINQFIVGGCSGNLADYIHELGHVAGMHHEHQRPNRDGFVSVTKTGSDFDKITAGSQTIGTSFDYNSIMLYPCGNGSGVNAKPGNACWVTATVLSDQDRLGVEQLYGNPYRSIILDKTGDGYNDLVQITSTGSDVVTYTGYYLQPSTGYRVAQVNAWIPWAGYGLENIYQYKKGDFDGDGKEDLVHLVSTAEYIHPWYGSASIPGGFDVAQFNLWPGYVVGSGNNYVSGNFKVGESSNNRTDIICIVPNQTYFNYFTCTTSRSWTAASVSTGFNVQDGTRYLAGDFDGKNGDDLIQFVSTTQCRIWLNKGTGSFEYFTFNPGYTMNISNVASNFRVFQADIFKPDHQAGNNYADILDNGAQKVWFGRADMSTTKRFDVY